MSGSIPTSNVSFSGIVNAYNNVNSTNLPTTNISLSSFRSKSFSDSTSVPSSGAISINSHFKGKTWGIPMLYTFSSHTFTNCGVTGRYGPTLTQCRTEYGGWPQWTGYTSYFNVSPTGYQIWTVPATASYQIDAYGARGGDIGWMDFSTYNHRYGAGARVRGTFALTEGDKYMISVGQMGSDARVWSTYEFSSHTFTNCGATGRTGPTLAQCRAHYSPSWTDDTSYFDVDNGTQKWTVPITGTYQIEVWGAQGGSGVGTGGYGAKIRATKDLDEGYIIDIVVGQQGQVVSSMGGGGGGSYVTRGGAKYIIAGGGGGNGNSGSCAANATYEYSGTQDTCGTGGYGGWGHPSYWGKGGRAGEGKAGGGGGWSYDGEGDAGGKARYGKHMGGTGGDGGDGGFGGGGGGDGFSSGGGGGFAGGGGGYYGGGGGGSMVDGMLENVEELGLNNTGHGKVIITYLHSYRGGPSGNPTNYTGGGGGGGTFVVKGTSYSQATTSDVLIVAGGGGGAGGWHWQEVGEGASSNSVSSTTGGSGGEFSHESGGGAGLMNNGEGVLVVDGTEYSYGKAFTNGGAGGQKGIHPLTYPPPNWYEGNSGVGGFGGGGGCTDYSGGGGGGYSGGDSGGGNMEGGDGGGSRNNGTSQYGQSGNNTGHGKVIITKL